MVEHIYQTGTNVTLDLISGKWKPLILCWLGYTPMRNGQFLNVISGISQKVLTQQLKELVADGLVSRTDFGEWPLHVEYSLTPEGASLRQILVELSLWGEAHAEKLRAAGQPIKLLYPGPETYVCKPADKDA